jgi:DNA-binding transcriptional MocR family regulator
MATWRPTLTDSGKPRYLAIADAVEEDIRNGTLAPGDRLPPQRKLAEWLGIDFTTVSRAYTEAQSRGLIDSHVGRGTFVLGTDAGDVGPDPARSSQEDLAMNMPPEPTDAALLAKMREGLEYVSTNLIPLLRYQSAIGGEKDKIAASTWLSLRGMVPKLDRVAVTPGAHATMTAILATITNPGDIVLCERITYPGIRAIAGRLRVKLVGVEMDGQGILPDAIEKAVKAFGAKALYLNPTLQNPTTITVPTERRLEISQVLRKHGLPLIEDDAYGFIPTKAPAPLAVSAPELSWYIGGLAKCIGAGLRLAYTVVPSAKDAYALAEALKAVSVMPSPLGMVLATRWIEDGTADRIRRFIRAETAARQQLASEVLKDFDYVSAENAFNVWLRLPEGAGRADIIARMAGRHIGIIPSDAFTVGGSPSEHVRVCLGGSIGREALRSGLLFMSHTLTQNAYSG